MKMRLKRNHVLLMLQDSARQRARDYIMSAGQEARAISHLSQEVRAISHLNHEATLSNIARRGHRIHSRIIFMLKVAVVIHVLRVDHENKAITIENVKTLRKAAKMVEFALSAITIVHDGRAVQMHRTNTLPRTSIHHSDSIAHLDKATHPPARLQDPLTSLARNNIGQSNSRAITSTLLHPKERSNLEGLLRGMEHVRQLASLARNNTRTGNLERVLKDM